MRGSLKIFSWFQIPVYLHWSFSLIVLYFLWEGYQTGLDLSGMALQMGLLFALFACVLLHEFGHALMARRYNVNTQDIILTPIGGIARLERMPENPRQELFVALAGPAVNVVIAIVIFLLARFIFFSDDVEWWFFKSVLSEWMGTLQASFTGQEFTGGDTDMAADSIGYNYPPWKISIPILFALNILMVVFNMLPAFPMDGGRVLRALLSMQIGRVRATQVAAILGQILAIGFVVTGLMSNAFTRVLIGFFVFMAARTENNMVRVESVLGKYKANDFTRPQFTSLNTNDWMQTPIGMLRTSLERHFLVFDFNENLMGYLSEKSIREAEKKGETTVNVATYMTSPVEIVHSSESLRYIHFIITNRKIPIVAVVNEENALVGVIDETALENFLKKA